MGYSHILSKVEPSFVVVWQQIRKYFQWQQYTIYMLQMYAIFGKYILAMMNTKLKTATDVAVCFFNFFLCNVIVFL